MVLPLAGDLEASAPRVAGAVVGALGIRSRRHVPIGNGQIVLIPPDKLPVE